MDRTLLETVQSVTVINPANLEELNRNFDLYQLFEQSANVARSGSFDFMIRGVAGTGPTNADSGARAVGVFVDGVTQTTRSTQANAQSLWDLEQIEILKGPQSTTIGRNTLAGALVLQSKMPEFEWGGSLLGKYGDHNTSQVAAAVTGPLAENLAFRVAAEHFHTDNFVSNPTLNQSDWDRESRIMGRILLLGKFGNGGQAVLNIRRNEFDDYGDDLVQPDNPEARISNFNSPSTWFTDSMNYSLNVSHPLSDYWDLSSITGYADSTFDRDSDADNNQGDSLLIQDTDQTEFSQEFRANYNGLRTRAVFGVYLAAGENDDRFTTDGLDFRGIIGPVAPIPLPISVTQAILEEYENIAAFANIDYDLTDRLTLLAGVRVDQEDRERSITGSGARQFTTGTPIDATVDNVLLGLTGAGSAIGDESSTVVLPKVGFQYELAPQIRAGFAYQRGYRPAGVSTNLVRGGIQEFDAEFTNNYEASLRSLWLEDRLSVSLNAFIVDWTDQQVTVTGPLGPFDSFIENAGESELYGFELESSFMLTSQLKIEGYIGYVDTEFTQFESGGQDFSGNRFGFARDWTVGGKMTYRADNGFYGNVNFQYSGDAFNDPYNAQLNYLDAFFFLNGKIGYKASNWGVSLFVNNALDDFYIAESYLARNAQTNAIEGGVITGEPRVFGVMAELKF